MVKQYFDNRMLSTTLWPYDEKSHDEKLYEWRMAKEHQAETIGLRAAFPSSWALFFAILLSHSSSDDTDNVWKFIMVIIKLLMMMLHTMTMTHLDNINL